MLESLRNFLTGPRLFIVIAACALPFVFLGTSSLTTAFGGSLGTINGENVSESDFQIASNMTIQKFKNIYGEDFDFGLLDEDIQLEQIKQELIVQKVLLSKARSFNLINKNTEKEAKISIIKNPAFQIDGRFDEGVYEAQVNSNGHTKDTYIKATTDLMASEVYRNSLAGLNFSTNVEIIELASILEQTVDLNFIKIDSKKLKNNISNTELELQAFYDNNQVRFYSDEERSFDYLLLKSEDYFNKVIVPDSFIDESYSNYLSKANERTQIRISHIMIDKNNYDTEKNAYDAIKIIENKLVEGANFSKLASEYSEDVVSKDSGGDLEYFSKDIFPDEFAEALTDLKLDDLSSIIELDESLHILKVTEFTKDQVLSIKEMEPRIVNELIASESLALMNDDYNLIDQMILSGDDLNSVGESLSKNITSSESYTVNNFNFFETDSRIKDYIFSPDVEIGEPLAIDLEDKIIIIALRDVNKSSLMSFEDVQDDVNEYLSQDKGSEKQILLLAQLAEAKLDGNLDEFISAYDFITKDNFVEVKRYSSLIPQEVLTEVFKFSSGDEVTAQSLNGDSYIVNITSINKPSEEVIADFLEQYKTFTDERLGNKISEIINNDIFTTAQVNLNNLVF